MGKLDPEVLAHLEWLGFVQPTGLVVSAPALVRAGCILDRRDASGQELLRAALSRDSPEDAPCIPDFEDFARSILGWGFAAKGFAGVGVSPIPNELHVALPDYGETLTPDYAVRELNPADGVAPWQLLVTTFAPGTDLDKVVTSSGLLEASPHGRMERLLRETGVPAGLLFNGTVLRLISAPRGESSGWLQFEVKAMAQTAGRPICTAMRLLLGQQRLLVLPKDKRLAALLDDSRKFQNEVSEKLAEQVLHALYEMLRGFQTAHDASAATKLLREPLDDDPDQVYRALLTVVLRLVFLLYAEERDMLPTHDEAFARYYSLSGLFSRLRDHAALYPDTMDQRYGAWAQLLVLFRMVHDGANAGEVKLPPRHGGLFDPDRYKFLEGRPEVSARQKHERIEPPRVPDGTIFRALEKLLVLDGERLSYRALDVEQIGSIYQTMMGFRLETATGQSLALKPKQRMGAPTTIDLNELLDIEPGKRVAHIKDTADRDLPAKVAAAIKEAATVAELHGALESVVDRDASPDLVPAGAMVLQPGDERRKSGSHYTPRTLTEPIVRETLAPILHRLRGEDGGPPTPEEILDLKVCDPAMGSAAFLVETCRQLGDALTDAWAIHGGRPEIPADEDEVIFARRLVAQRCLYGLDRNPVAADLAKMSLWLATLASDHALTFLDHALRTGDALVGLSRSQIQTFHWDDKKPPLAPIRIARHMERVLELREEIRTAGEEVSDSALRDMWDEVQAELDEVRLFGDLVVVAFFSGAKPREREAKRAEFVAAVTNGSADQYRRTVDQARAGDPPIAPFHWGIEFPEVFERDTPGFDAFVGNPPFFAGAWLKGLVGPVYRDYLVQEVALGKTGLRGTADLCVYFMLRVVPLLRFGGCVGLVLSSTVAEGDSKEVGIQQLIDDGITLYRAIPKFRWPGQANVDVVMLWMTTTRDVEAFFINGKPVSAIYSNLTDRVSAGEPVKLASNAPLICKGHELQGDGFKLTPEEAEALVREFPDYRTVVKPLITGEDLNSSPVRTPSAYVINFAEMDLDEARLYPDALTIVEERVKPEREEYTGDSGRDKYLRTYWWRFRGFRRDLARYEHSHDRVLACSVVSKHLVFAFVPSGWVATPSMYCFLLDGFGDFAVMQSRVHTLWANAQSSSLGANLRYIGGRCFNMFPLADKRERLDGVGERYYRHREAMMLDAGLGLTDTYNRFHNPEDDGADIVKLRELHKEMDRGVLDAYGWTDIPTDYEFLLDHEVNGDDTGRRTKPWLYRWPDDVQDAVLARMLALNGERAAEEQRSGVATLPAKKVPSSPTKAAPQTDGLF
jgi:hypothetical protein